MPEGGLECWAVLSGLEILAACQKHDTGQVDKCALFTAHLWDHIRNKVGSLVVTVLLVFVRVVVVIIENKISFRCRSKDIQYRD